MKSKGDYDGSVPLAILLNVLGTYASIPSKEYCKNGTKKF